MSRKLTKAQQSLVRLMTWANPRSIFRREAAQHGMTEDFDRAVKAGLLRSAGCETSVAAEDFLDSALGRTAIKQGADDA